MSDNDKFAGYVEFFLQELRPDPAQYKPYSPTFSPVQAVVVRVPLDEDLVLGWDLADGDGVVVVGLEGLKDIIVKLADTLQSVDDERHPERRQVTRTSLH